MPTSLTNRIEAYQQNKAKYRFFELNCWSPLTSQSMLHPVLGIKALSNELAKHHITEAMVTNAECIEYNPAVGNENLILQIKDHEHIYGSIVWVPEISRTKSETRNYIEHMMTHRIASVRLFPKKLNHSLKKWQVGDLLQIMEAKRLPLILWHNETNWDTVHNICEEYPLLPVIVEGNDQKLLYHNRFFIPLLEKCPNLYIETHNLIHFGGIEYIVNECGIDRLLFGSYFPYNDPDSAMMMITDADIPEEAKYAIAGGHMRHLIAQSVDEHFNG